MKLVEFQKVAMILAKQHKIKIHEGKGWAANIKNRDVYYRKEDIYTLPEEHILGMLLHEIAHIHYTTAIDYPEKNKELLHVTTNMIEDIAIENIIGKDYPNAKEILSTTKEEVLDTLIKMLPEITDVSLHEKALLYAAARFEERGYSFGIEKYEKIGEKISKIMIKEKQKILNRKETKDLLPISKEIVKLLIQKAREPTQEEKNKMNRNNDQEGKATNAQKETTVKRKIIKTLKGGNGWNQGTASDKITFIDEITDQASMIGKKLRSILKRNNSMEFGGRYRTGKLLAKRFVRIRVLKDRQPFAKRIIKSNKSYAFAIASDISGSMFSNYYSDTPSKDSASYALSSMYMVGEALRQANIPRNLILFAYEATTVAKMGKTQISWNQISNEKNIDKVDIGGTDISKAIVECTKELNKIRAERKIMIILTDGNSNIQDMKEAHKEATKKGIECLGITINRYNSNSIDQVFSQKKNIVIKDTKNTKLIGKAFIDILKTSITKSK